MRQALLVLTDIANFLMDVVFLLILLLLFVGLSIRMLVEAFFLFQSGWASVIIALLSIAVFAYTAFAIKEYVFPALRGVRTGEKLSWLVTPFRKIFALVGLCSLAKLFYLTLFKDEGEWWNIALKFIMSL